MDTPQTRDWRELCSDPSCLTLTRAWCSVCKRPVCDDHCTYTATRRVYCASCEPTSKEQPR